MKISPSLLLLLLWMQICQAQFPKEANIAPVPGWPGLRWGMTTAEVMEVFKGEAELIPKDQIQYPADGAPELVRIAKLVKLGISYQVRFGFDAVPFTHWSNRRTNANGLSWIHMTTYPKRTDVHRLTTNVIQPSLEKEFGSPIGRESMDQSQDHYAVNWGLPSTYVHLEVEIPKSETNDRTVISVSYSAARLPVE